MVILTSISLYSLNSIIVLKEGKGFFLFLSTFNDFILLFTFTNQWCFVASFMVILLSHKKITYSNHFPIISSINLIMKNYCSVSLIFKKMSFLILILLHQFYLHLSQINPSINRNPFLLFTPIILLLFSNTFYFGS